MWNAIRDPDGSRHHLLYIGAPKSCSLEEGPSRVRGRFVGSLQGMTNAKRKPRPKDHGVVTRLGGAGHAGGVATGTSFDLHRVPADEKGETMSLLGQ